MSNILDENICKEITEFIYELTNKNYKVINEEILKKLLNVCGNQDIYIERVYRLLMDCLGKTHSEIRYNTFYILNAFFKQYHPFRQLVVDNLKYLLDLTTNINYDIRLPPPKAVANELNRFALKSVKEWTQNFGSSYKKLDLCYEFLRRKKNVDFEKLEIEDRASRLRRQADQEKKQKSVEQKLRLLRNEIKDLKPEIDSLIKSLESCLEMLVPTLEEFFINDLADQNLNHVSEDNSTPDVLSVDEINDNMSTETDENAATFRETGMLKGNFSININLPEIRKSIKIEETDENSVIIENAKDHYKLLSKKYVETVKNWVKNLTALSENSAELKYVIELKTKVETIIQKFENLIFEKVKPPSENEDSDSDSDMEEVVPHIPTVDEELIASLKENKSDLNRMDFKVSPGPSSSNKNYVLDKVHIEEVNERKKKLLEVAPKLPFDVDLYHWEDENLRTPMLLPVTAEGRHFWSATSFDDTDGIPIPEGTASLRTRIIEFSGKFEPVKWSCRFPMSNGTLCPRRDRFKCPFHGSIVARNELGNCINPEDAKKDEELKSKMNYSEALNPKLLAEIQMATGIDMKIPKRKKRRKTNDDSLTNIKKEQDTVRKRLEKKLFKKSTVKRVAETLDNLDRKRFRDKYGDQFQYVHGTT